MMVCATAVATRFRESAPWCEYLFFGGCFMANANGRPPSINSRYFYRELTMPDKMVLACAGSGNITIGFRNVIDTYQTLWNAGYRPEMDLSEFLGQYKGETQ